MGEKNILAYFRTPEEAEGAAKKLRALRAADVSVDRISGAPGAGAYREDRGGRTMSGGFSLADLALGADAGDRNAEILLAAGPDASGMSGGGREESGGRDVLLAAVVDEDVHQMALRVIEEAGGKV